jgi:hypothetical protein
MVHYKNLIPQDIKKASYPYLENIISIIVINITHVLMKITSNVYTRNLLIILAILICFVGNLLYHFTFKNFINQPELPAKYAAYKTLAESPTSTHYEIKPLFAYVSDNRTFSVPRYYPEEQIVRIYSHTDAPQQDKIVTCYKFDPAGNLVDSSTSQKEPIDAASTYQTLPDLTTNDTIFKTPNKTIYQDYFYKASLLLPPDTWLGTGYIHLIMKTDTLKFKEDDLFQLSYYKNEHIDFGLLKNRFSNFYIVKAKSN